MIDPCPLNRPKAIELLKDPFVSRYRSRRQIKLLKHRAVSFFKIYICFWGCRFQQVHFLLTGTKVKILEFFGMSLWDRQLCIYSVLAMSVVHNLDLFFFNNDLKPTIPFFTCLLYVSVEEILGKRKVFPRKKSSKNLGFPSCWRFSTIIPIGFTY